VRPGDGFTLTEVLVVMAIVGILAAVAYPAYLDQVRKGRRSDGQAMLNLVAARQEQYYLDNKSFTTDMTDLGLGADPADSPEGYYSVDAAAGSTGSIATSFALTATRAGAQTSDTLCGDLTLNSAAAKSAINHTSSDPLRDCW
jgi:type IV pilus assembly protein PilE